MKKAVEVPTYPLNLLYFLTITHTDIDANPPRKIIFGLLYNRVKTPKIMTSDSQKEAQRRYAEKHPEKLKEARKRHEEKRGKRDRAAYYREYRRRKKAEREAEKIIKEL